MKRPNLYILLLICALVIVDVVFLRPAAIETTEEEPRGMYTSIENQVETRKKNDEIKYTIEGLHYTAVEAGKKQWEMTAREAVVFDKSNVAEAEDVSMRMFDPEEKITFIEGDKGVFRMGAREFDMSGHLKVTFPDGFWLKTERAHYSTVDQRVSSQEPFYGEARTPQKELLRLWGTGFLGSKTGPDIYVLNECRVRIKRPRQEDLTDIRSDTARIDRVAKFAEFSMKDKDRFVESNQGSLYVRSKRQEASYDSSASVLKYLTAYDDVLIRETDEKNGISGMKYATAQKAEFLALKNQILLSGFPSVYQERDTVTGDAIIVHRDTNVVEVTEANAYHEGTETDPKARGAKPL
ncbi:MAG: LPS export ABC transporter periplasmic protein LptC [Deltaproteobacteria bacterium]|nr:LPS export ABC transporter periplasmic protein LptC [Deltaproteobacteria bacterium]